MGGGTRLVSSLDQKVPSWGKCPTQEKTSGRAGRESELENLGSTSCGEGARLLKAPGSDPSLVWVLGFQVGFWASDAAGPGSSPLHGPTVWLWLGSAASTPVCHRDRLHENLHVVSAGDPGQVAGG